MVKFWQVIELGKEATTSFVLEVNALNKSALIALDLLLIFPSEAGNREIKEILRDAGAIKARDRDRHNILCPASSFEFGNHIQVSNPSASVTSLVQPKNLVKYFKFKKGRDSPSDARNVLLVISVLVATATFQVGLSPPGGFWQDGSLAGRSILGSNSEVTFLLFVLFNSIGFSVSLFTINILTTNFPLHFELQICMIAMFITYNNAVTTTAPNGVKFLIIIFTSALPSMIALLADEVRRLTLRLRKFYRSSCEG
ncbi:uncharacterized protein LOC142620401 [Castanea sativa]|uniref:uncharacterized protein LOC142620401 n=1 Tax=Castanea sativa TaxID=21020 RepID=UPI003F64AACA